MHSTPSGIGALAEKDRLRPCLLAAGYEGTKVGSESGYQRGGMGLRRTHQRPRPEGLGYAQMMANNALGAFWDYPFEVFIGGTPPAVLADQVKSLDWRSCDAKPKAVCRRNNWPK